MDSSHFLAALEHSGVDTAAGLARFMGNEALYIRFLCRLPQSLDADALRGALCRRDGETFYALAHDLKGVTGNLSIPTLFAVCGRILEEYRAQGLARIPLLESLVQELETAALPLLELIKEYEGA